MRLTGIYPCSAVCLEEGLHHETTRGAALEAQWKATKATLDALILDGDVDVVSGVTSGAADAGGGLDVASG
eukprot:1149498-Pelagomonas_calceolata.AAC.4